MERLYRNKIYKNYLKEIKKRQAFSSYEKERQMIIKYVKRNYIKLLPQNKNAEILDLGCGMGHYLFALQKLGYLNLTGIDISNSNVKFCQSQGLPVLQYDITDYLENCNKQYDAIIFNDVIEHMTKEEIMKTLFLIKKVLKRGGVVITKTDNEANPFTGISGRYMDFTHEVGFVSLSLQQVFEAAGYINVSVKGADIYVFGGIIGYIMKAISKIIYFLFFLLCCMAGRWSIQIFEKCIICIAYKGNE